MYQHRGKGLRTPYTVPFVASSDKTSLSGGDQEVLVQIGQLGSWVVGELGSSSRGM